MTEWITIGITMHAKVSKKGRDTDSIFCVPSVSFYLRGKGLFNHPRRGGSCCVCVCGGGGGVRMVGPPNLIRREIRRFLRA